MEAKRDDSADRVDFEYYLPGMPRVTTRPGRVERFLKRLLRRRGRYRVRVSHQGK